MSQGAVTAGGFKLRFGQYTFRIWSKGFEYGNRFGGRVVLFPWAKK